MNNSPSMKSSAAGGTATWLPPRWPAPVHSRTLGTTFFAAHAWIPLVAFVALVVWSMALGGDQWMADRLYAWEGNGWSLRHAFLTERVVHQFGRTLSTAAWLAALLAWLVARARPQWAHLRRPLAYLLVSVTVSTAMVAWVKSWSNMDCPWDLVRYGGAREYVGLLGMRPLGLARGACFPAGHASGGYAWLALYFFLGAVRPNLRWLGLAIGLSVGLVFGISQQLRGAHFFSHDLWTIAICWASALGLHLWFQRRSMEAAAPVAALPRITR